MTDPLEHLTIQIMSATHPKTFSLYAYGSSLYRCAEGRDIDLTLVSPELSEPSLSVVFSYIAGRSVPANLYLVPESCFLADVERLAYGGYYSHKFAFAFRLLAKNGDAPDSGRVFWSYQLQRHWSRLTHPVKAEALMRLVHAEIYEFNPFVARSMTKFLSSPEACETLREFLGNQVITELVDASFPSFSGDLPDERERVLYRFWAEYRRHKQRTDKWGNAVREKMQVSLREADYALLERYMAPIAPGGESVRQA